MSVQEFANTTTGIFAALTSMIVAGSAFIASYRAYLAAKRRTKRAEEPKGQNFAPLSIAVVGAIFVGIAMTIAGVRLFSTTPATNGPTPPPSVVITDPSDGSVVNIHLEPNGSARFSVRGTATNVARTDALFLLVHPEEPFGEGWWVQAAPSGPFGKGDWSGVGWIGTRGFEPKTGDMLWIAAVIAPRDAPIGRSPQGQRWVTDPGALSGTIAISRVTVGAVTTP